MLQSLERKREQAASKRHSWKKKKKKVGTWEVFRETAERKGEGSENEGFKGERLFVDIVHRPLPNFHLGSTLGFLYGLSFSTTWPNGPYPFYKNTNKPPLVGEENKPLFIRMWKPSPTICFKALGGSPKGKAQRGLGKAQRRTNHHL